MSELSGAAEKWIYFLKEADNLDDIPDSLKEDRDISRAFEMAYKMNLSKEELLSMDKRVQFASQMKALERDAKESYQKGIEKGTEKGIEKGIEKERNLSLQALIKSGVSESEAKKILNIE